MRSFSEWYLNHNVSTLFSLLFKECAALLVVLYGDCGPHTHGFVGAARPHASGMGSFAPRGE